MAAARVKAWNRGEKWTAAGVIMAVVASIGAFLVPEVRRFFRLEPEPAVSAIETRRRDPSPHSSTLTLENLSALPPALLMNYGSKMAL